MLVDQFGVAFSPVPRIPTGEIVTGGPLDRWTRRLRAGLLGEVEGKPETYIRDALWSDACAEAVAIHRKTGYGRQQ